MGGDKAIVDPFVNVELRSWYITQAKPLVQWSSSPHVFKVWEFEVELPSVSSKWADPVSAKQVKQQWKTEWKKKK